MHERSSTTPHPIHSLKNKQPRAVMKQPPSMASPGTYPGQPPRNGPRGSDAVAPAPPPPATHRMPDKGGHGSVPPTYSQAVGEWEDGSRPGPSPFNVAARQGDLDEIKRLVANGGNMFATGEIGQTPAYSAVVTGHTEILEYLIQHGADYTAGNEDGFTPLNAAATKNYPETLLLLLRYGADPNAPTVDGQTPVWSAANEGHLDTVRILVEHGVNFSHCRNDRGFTPVCAAAGEGHADIVQFLVSHGADVTLATVHGVTPLRAADHTGVCPSTVGAFGSAP